MFKRMSIRTQLSLVCISMILLVLVSIFACNYGLLEDFYVSAKTKNLLEGMEQLNGTEELTTESDFSQFCVTNNMSYVVLNEDGQGGYSNLPSMESQRLASRLFGYNTGIDKEEPEIIKKTDQYTIQKNDDIDSEITYIEIWGELEDGRSFIIRSPLQSIKESVTLANHFSLYIGIVVIIVALISIWIVSKRMTKSISDLTKISQKMANLDFETRYEGGGSAEISLLGNNFNKMSETLEKAISELKSANNKLQEDIEKKTQIDEMRKEFLSNVSHELKTPIALIQGYAEGLQDNINDDPESREFYCEVIVDEANKMNIMVKKLLTLNQLEFGNDQISMERFDITALLQGVIQANTLRAGQKDAEIIFRQKEPIYVWGDEFKVEEVITNFVSNAINHVKNENKIEVRCLHKEDKVRVTVFNTGDPIPESDLDKIWIKFYKVDKARTREYGGSGIGLSIVKAIMESMHQECGVKNYENGVEFWFELETKA